MGAEMRFVDFATTLFAVFASLCVLILVCSVSLESSSLLNVQLRLRQVLPGLRSRPTRQRLRGSQTYVLIVLGSGGHTAEMLMILRDLDPSIYRYRRYVISSGDDFSERKARAFEQSLEEWTGGSEELYGFFDIKLVPRARKIHQSLLTTAVSALRCGRTCFELLRDPPMGHQKRKDGMFQRTKRYPDLVLANGPATATILIAACIFCRFLALPGSRRAMRCVYVESWARVKKLSLSGYLLWRSGACDRMLVQWPDLLLDARGRRRKGLEYHGVLVG